MPAIRGVGFDLDGTLFDSSSVSRHALKDGFERFWAEIGEDGHVPSWEEASRLIGLPSRQFYPAILAAPYREHWRLLNRLVSEAEIRGLREGKGRTFEGVHDTLEALRAMGFWLGCVSNASKPYFDAVLDECRLREYFPDLAWLGEDARTTKADVLRRWAERVGGKRALVYVGDRGGDIEAAHAVGLLAAGVTYGYGSAEELASADIRINALWELVAVLEGAGS